MYKSLYIAILMFVVVPFFAQNTTMLAEADNEGKVMLIGENEDIYEGLVRDCNSLLLQVANNSMEAAFDLWQEMLADIENQAELSNFDIKGIKIWINVFWEEDGSIKKIVYYPKPNSRNMDFEELTSFFEEFADSYQLSQEFGKCFSHYGSASFPTFSKVKPRAEK